MAAIAVVDKQLDILKQGLKKDKHMCIYIYIYVYYIHTNHLGMLVLMGSRSIAALALTFGGALREKLEAPMSASHF